MSLGFSAAPVPQPRSKVVSIDLKTGLAKPRNPLKDANDYGKWDQIDISLEDHDGEPVDFVWQQLPYDEIRVRIPVSQYTKSKNCKVVVKRNWLYVTSCSTSAVSEHLLL